MKLLILKNILHQYTSFVEMGHTVGELSQFFAFSGEV